LSVSIYNGFLSKGGDRVGVIEMNNGEIMQRAVDDFRDIQRYMLLAREENSVKTYEALKEKYLSLKAILNNLGVNMSDIDKMKE